LRFGCSRTPRLLSRGFNVRDITKQTLKTHAERLLEKIEEEKISSLESALLSKNKHLFIREILPDYVFIFISPSNHGTTALKISYICPTSEGIPLELVINSTLDYNQVLIKCAEPIKGYSSFGVDIYSNIRQFKKNPGSEWITSIQNIEELSRAI